MIATSPRVDTEVSSTATATRRTGVATRATVGQPNGAGLGGPRIGDFQQGEAITLRDRDIDRLLQSLFGCALFLTVLWLWRLSYTGSGGRVHRPGRAHGAPPDTVSSPVLSVPRGEGRVHPARFSPWTSAGVRRSRPARGGPPAAEAATLSGRGLPLRVKLTNGTSKEDHARRARTA